MKKKKYIIITIILILLLVIIINYNQRVPVLGYHAFYKYESELQEENPEFINNIDSFEKQMKYLKTHNYKTLTLDEFYEWKKGKLKIPRKSVLITIDDGSLSNYMYAFDILKKYDINAVVFYIGINSEKFGKNEGNIYDFMSYELIEKSKKEYPNIEFQSHSYDMHGSGVKGKTKEELEKDIESMNKQGNFKYFAYPFGINSEDMINVLKENGYKMAFGFGSGKNGEKTFKKATKNDDDYLISRLNISNYVSFNKFLLRLYFPY